MVKPSLVQEALLATEELHARTAIYNLVGGVWIDGDLDVAALAARCARSSGVTPCCAPRSTAIAA